ncbi:MBL fold metallo-hydrolase [uncultured Desulfobacter sp.]|uniref:MBL fold metallo-hydrolase n=1 Tax=uncultured Desulfobacter sp. TaxID=240139 RepID=UPI002AABC86C|nr:MBL fold metallo-hydrolase [uncultured Desulfobacter sp.]
MFVLKTDTGLILFDTGSYGSADRILKSIKAAGFEPETIKAICLTHWHGDHTGGLAGITAFLGANQSLDIFIGEADLPLLKDQSFHLLRFHPFLQLPVLHGPGRLPNSSNARFCPLNTAGCEILHQKYGITAIDTPGHTPGHMAYLHRETGSLFSGCALSLLTPHVAGLVPVFHDRAEQIRSGEYLAGMDFRYLLPAHMCLRRDEIPLERRRPVSGKKGVVSKLMGDHLFFKIL